METRQTLSLSFDAAAVVTTRQELIATYCDLFQALETLADICYLVTAV